MPATRFLPALTPLRLRRGRNLAQDLVLRLGDRIRDGRLIAGARLPTEAELMAEHGVSRTVVREALSSLQAAGLTHTRHGVGSFVAQSIAAAPFRVTPERLGSLQEVLEVLELRMGLETEAAALAAHRRTEANLDALRAALDDFSAALQQGQDAAAADWRFHLEVARASQNPRFAELMGALGIGMIPRVRLDGGGAVAAAPVQASAKGTALNGGNEGGETSERLAAAEARRRYLLRVAGEHENIFEAIAAGDAEAARAGMRLHLVNGRERRRRQSTS